MSDTRTTAGLRQPLLIRIYGCGCTETLVFRRFGCLPRGADAPRSCLLHDRSLVKKRFLRCRNAHYQERRASARRGLRAAPATATVYRGEGTFRPWTRLARATIENRNRSAAIVGEQERRASARRGRDKRSGAEKRIRRAWRASESRAAGVSPPWLGKRNCRNASGESGRLPAVCSQTPVQSR